MRQNFIYLEKNLKLNAYTDKPRDINRSLLLRNMEANFKREAKRVKDGFRKDEIVHCKSINII